MVNNRSFQRAVEEAAKACDEGLFVSEALIPAAQFFPSFFLPLVTAGELSGRQVEAFRLVEFYCQHLRPALTAVRKTWLVPVICVVFGWTVRLGLFVGFGLYFQAGQFLRDTAGTVLALGMAGWILTKPPAVKEIWDRMMLGLPVVREVEIALSVSLFLSAFRLLYSTGGLSVIRMVDHALATVRNSVVRRDLLQIRTVIEQGGTLEDAFLKPSLFSPNQSGIIATSAAAGRLDEGLERAASQALGELESSLDVFNRFFHRAVTASVTASIVGTVWICLNYSGR
jgi:type II secretory pathway component PulF